MDKHKIIVFSTAYFPYVGGAEIAIENIAKRLHDRFDFLILTSRFRRGLRKKEIRSEGAIRRFGFGTSFDKFLLIPFSFIFVVWNLMFGVWKLKIENWKSPQQNSKRILLWGVDTGQASLAAALIKFVFPSVKFILTLQYGESERHLKNSRSGFVGWGLRFMLRRADHVTAISSYLLDLAKRYGYEGAGEVIPNGVDIKNFQFPIFNFQTSKEKDNKIIITVSRLVKKNGIDTLIKAVAEVKKNIPEICCWILGDGPERQKLELQATSYKLQANIKFFGNISHAKIPGYLHEAGIFVRPSRSEGMGNSFIEAIAAGLPIIGTPVGGITDIITDGKTGFFVKPDDPHALAERIIYVLQNPDMAQRTVVSGREMVEARFSWGCISSAYAEIFRGVADNLRLLIATPLFPPDIGGPATYSFLLSRELSKLGISVKILTFGSVRYLPKLVRHAVYFLKLLSMGRGVDIIFAQDPVSVGLPAAIASRVLGKKFILKIVGDYAWEQGRQRFGVSEDLDDFLTHHYGWRVEFFRRIQRFSALSARSVVVPSNYLAGVVECWGIDRKKIIVIYNSLEFPSFIAEPDAREKARGALKWEGIYLVSAGRLVPWKGFAMLIKLMPELRAKMHDLRLVIIGSGPMRGELEREAKECGVSDAVEFLGDMAQKEVLHAFLAGDLFLLNTAYEGFSHTILEAMACGIPVLTTPVGGNKEIIHTGENGILLAYNNEKAWREEILRILRDRNLRGKISVNSRENIKKFGKDLMLQNITALIKAL